MASRFIKPFLQNKRFIAATLGFSALSYSAYHFVSGQNILAAESPVALNPQEFVDFELIEISKVTHDTNRFRFALPSPDHVLGLTTCGAIVTKAEINGKTIIRPYTPVSKPNQKGYFDIIVKRYEDGNMSKHIHELKVGDKLAVKGPIPKYQYKPNEKKKIGLVAGGTGIAPMYQVVREVLDNPEDKTELYLVFANKTENDIILKEEFDELAQKHKNFHVFYSVDNPITPDWNGGKGFISREMLEEKMFTPTENEEEVLVMVCGPPGFMDHISGNKTKDYKQGELKGLLKEMGFSEKNVYKF